MRRAWILGGAVVVVGTAVLVVLLRSGDREGPAGAAEAWLSAWSEGRYDDLAALAVDPPAGMVEAHEQMDDGLRVAGRRFEIRAAREEGGRASVDVDAMLDLTGLGEWAYGTELSLERRDGEWLVAWRPEVLHPERVDGRRFARARRWPERAPITGAGGVPLASQAEVISVGVEPRRITDRAAVAAALEATVGVDAAALDRALAAPGVQPDHYVPLVEVRPERYDEVRPALFPVPGVLFRRGTARLPLADGFASHVLGRVAEVTADRLDELGPPYQVGDEVGLSGLEAVFERRLAGTPQGEVQLVDDAGATVATLHEFRSTPPEAVAVTIDPTVQAAAEAALVDVASPAALVAVDPATGAVRAVVSRPLEEGFNRALAGRYPPGSTFKVVTTAALLASGITPDTSVTCPAEASVGGKPFRNFESEALGTVPFRQAFVSSCNTAFVQLAADAGAGAVADVARRFGFGADYELPLRVAGGAFPEPSDEAELAAAAIGQGRVTASPLHMATVAGAVAAGAWRPPHLLDARGGAPPAVLDVGTTATIAELMRLVVASGTGTAASVPGRDVAGKTGTAEFDAGDPPPTHAWFIGFSGDLAFAVVVEGGGVGGEVAAPLAARFLAGT